MTLWRTPWCFSSFVCLFVRRFSADPGHINPQSFAREKKTCRFLLSVSSSFCFSLSLKRAQSTETSPCPRCTTRSRMKQANGKSGFIRTALLVNSSSRQSSTNSPKPARTCTDCTSYCSQTASVSHPACFQPPILQRWRFIDSFITQRSHELQFNYASTKTPFIRYYIAISVCCIDFIQYIIIGRSFRKFPHIRLLFIYFSFQIFIFWFFVCLFFEIYIFIYLFFVWLVGCFFFFSQRLFRKRRALARDIGDILALTRNHSDPHLSPDSPWNTWYQRPTEKVIIIWRTVRSDVRIVVLLKEPEQKDGKMSLFCITGSYDGI